MNAMKLGCFVDLDFHGLAIALAALREPFAHGRCEPVWVYAQASLETPYARRQSVVELRRARKIPHAEAIEPVERGRPPVAANDDSRSQFSRVHLAGSIASRMGLPRPYGLTPCSFSASRGNILWPSVRTVRI